MSRSAPTGDSGDAVERLQDEQWHILDLFETYMRHRSDPRQPVAELTRLATLIYTLLRVHCELETMLLRPALTQEPGMRPLLTRANDKRNAMLDALERTEAVSPRDPAHHQEMDTLSQLVRAGFQEHEDGVFARLRRSRLDLQSLDQEMAARQEDLLSAGRNAARHGGARQHGPASG